MKCVWVVDVGSYLYSDPEPNPYPGTSGIFERYTDAMAALASQIHGWFENNTDGWEDEDELPEYSFDYEYRGPEYGNEEYFSLEDDAHVIMWNVFPMKLTQTIDNFDELPNPIKCWNCGNTSFQYVEPIQGTRKVIGWINETLHIDGYIKFPNYDGDEDEAWVECESCLYPYKLPEKREFI